MSDPGRHLEPVRIGLPFAIGEEPDERPHRDMNAEPDSDEVRLLCGHKTAPVRDRFVLVDAWRYAAEGAVPWTWDRENPHVAATMEPSSRIDYVLVAPPHEGRRGHVRAVRRIGEAPVRGVWASDHAGVLAQLATRRAVRVVRARRPIGASARTAGRGGAASS